MPNWAVECKDVSTQITDTTASCQVSERRAGKAEVLMITKGSEAYA